MHQILQVISLIVKMRLVNKKINLKKRINQKKKIHPNTKVDFYVGKKEKNKFVRKINRKLK